MNAVTVADEINAWRETLYLLSNPVNAARLRQSIAEWQAGEATEQKVTEVLDQIGDVIKEQGLTLDELIESGREERAQIIEERYDYLIKS